MQATLGLPSFFHCPAGGGPQQGPVFLQLGAAARHDVRAPGTTHDCILPEQSTRLCPFADLAGRKIRSTSPRARRPPTRRSLTNRPGAQGQQCPGHHPLRELSRSDERPAWVSGKPPRAVPPPDSRNPRRPPPRSTATRSGPGATPTLPLAPPRIHAAQRLARGCPMLRYQRGTLSNQHADQDSRQLTHPARNGHAPCPPTR